MAKIIGSFKATPPDWPVSLYHNQTDVVEIFDDMTYRYSTYKDKDKNSYLKIDGGELYFRHYEGEPWEYSPVDYFTSNVMKIIEDYAFETEFLGRKD